MKNNIIYFWLDPVEQKQPKRQREAHSLGPEHLRVKNSPGSYHVLILSLLHIPVLAN